MVAGSRRASKETPGHILRAEVTMAAAAATIYLRDMRSHAQKLVLWTWHLGGPELARPYAAAFWTLDLEQLPIARKSSVYSVKAAHVR